jgi:hypothetical protein
LTFWYFTISPNMGDESIIEFFAYASNMCLSDQTQLAILCLA